METRIEKYAKLQVRKRQILIKELNSFCKYNPETGELISIKRRPYTHEIVGQSLGTLNNGYLMIYIKGIHYYNHRLAWLLNYKVWPTNEIDHIDGNRANNKLSNLRDVTVNINQQNTKLNKRNKSGVTGVIWNWEASKWKARIGINNKDIHLGFYEDFLDAVDARLVAEKKYGFINRHTL